MQREPFYNDEIDLREIVLTLWKGRWVIIGLTLVAVVASFAINKWLLPEKYQARAYVLIVEPTIQFTEASDNLINLSMPDLTSVTELAANPALLERVINSPEIAQLWDEEKDFITDMIDVVAVGKDHLRLQIIDTNPERAMLLANFWAEQVVTQINALYGLDVFAQALNSQVVRAHEEYAQAQTSLEVELSRSTIDILDAKLVRSKSDLTCILNRSSATTLILEDLQILERSLNMKIGATLSLGDALSLSTLQQRTYASDICSSQIQNPQLQIGNETLVGVTILDALGDILQMREALLLQIPFIQEERARLETEIPSLQRELAIEKYKFDQLEQVRDLTQRTYISLLEQQNHVKTIILISDKIALVSTKAIIPNEPIFSNVLMNSGLFGTLGFIFGVIWILVIGWWGEGKLGGEK